MSQIIETKCCIIGAGVSGLKSAHTLLNSPQSKFKPSDILIVEGQDYIGGRLLTDKNSSKIGYSYDLGAAWFHDCLTNINLKEALEENDKSVFDFEKDGFFDDKEMIYYDKDCNGPVPVDDLRLNRIIEELMKFIEIHYHQGIDTPDMSLLEITDLYIKRYGNRLSDIQKTYVKKSVRFLELWFGLSSDSISAKYAMMDHEGRNLYNLKGYSYLIEKLLKDIPKSSFKLNTQVTKIARNNKERNKKVLIETNNSKIYCDYVVVTVPLSILKLPESDPYSIKWEPPLPSNLSAALEKSSFCSLGKVIFEFDTTWWDSETQRILYLPETTESTGLSEPLTLLPSSVKYPYLIINYEAMHADTKSSRNGAGSFVILTQNPLTEYLESHPEQAWDYFKESFEKFVVPGKKVTKPINVLTTKWTTNPFIRGSYSAVKTNDSFEDIIVQLSGEVEGTGISHSTIRFAGEHTALDGNGCVHGAYTTGKKQAEWIISHYNSTRPSL